VKELEARDTNQKETVSQLAQTEQQPSEPVPTTTATDDEAAPSKKKKKKSKKNKQAKNEVGESLDQTKEVVTQEEQSKQPPVHPPKKQVVPKSQEPMEQRAPAKKQPAKPTNSDSSTDEDEYLPPQPVKTQPRPDQAKTATKKKKQQQPTVNYAEHFSGVGAQEEEKKAAASLEDIMKDEAHNPDSQPHYEPAPKNYFEVTFDEASKNKKKGGKGKNNIDKIMVE